MHSTHIEGKPVIAERFIRTLKNKNKNRTLKNNTSLQYQKMCVLVN